MRAPISRAASGCIIAGLRSKNQRDVRPLASVNASSLPPSRKERSRTRSTSRARRASSARLASTVMAPRPCGGSINLPEHDVGLMNGRPDCSSMASTEAVGAPHHDPLLGLDVARLEAEMERYHLWLDERTEEAYAIAEAARAKRFDPRDHVEIPRAADLASRTEKLLVEHLDGHPVADDIRAMLAEHDRETTSILMAQKVAAAFRDNGYDMVKSIDVGLRVGLAVLTEAVLVAPLEGISEVRLLSNVDGSSFVSVYFAGPIRAAGGTAQALAVLIADMIRRELGIDPYKPTDPEVERVKEEFGLFRGNLQYRPSPAEIEEIVRACPIMINGESTERIECAGYGRVRNVDDTRIRGGVLLVIGEGMCLKAPKIQKHTERLKVPGWDFISKFAAKGKEKEEGGAKGFTSRQVAPISKFMNDIIAGRPVFGAPLEAGGFRLRYGRARPSGLAAASANPACMAAMDDFITVGTQMKIERPGKACAITPCDESEGPWVILRNGSFRRIDDLNAYLALARGRGLGLGQRRVGVGLRRIHGEQQVAGARRLHHRLVGLRHAQRAGHGGRHRGPCGLAGMLPLGHAGRRARPRAGRRRCGPCAGPQRMASVAASPNADVGPSQGRRPAVRHLHGAAQQPVVPRPAHRMDAGMARPLVWGLHRRRERSARAADCGRRVQLVGRRDGRIAARGRARSRLAGRPWTIGPPGGGHLHRTGRRNGGPSSSTVWPRAPPSCSVCSIGTTARTCSSPAVGKRCWKALASPAKVHSRSPSRTWPRP